MSLDDAQFEEQLQKWLKLRLSDPKNALELAEEAITLAEDIGLRRKARALGTKASSLHALGQYKAAEDLYLEAEFILEELSESALEEFAELKLRKASLKSSQFSVEDALRLTDEAIKIYRQLTDCHLLGIGMFEKGAICGDHGRQTEAIKLLSEALTKIDPKRCEIRYFAALQNLFTLVVQCDDLRALQNLRPKLKRARKVWWRNPANKIPLLKMRWLDALIVAKHGSARHAIRLLSTVHAEFVELDMPFEIGLTALDLASFFAIVGDTPTAMKLATKAQGHLEAPIDTGALTDLDAVARMRYEASVRRRR